MCCGTEPLLDSVFGIPLRRSVFLAGVVQLFITIITTIFSTIQYAQYRNSAYGDLCDGTDWCIGPLLRFAVFDALSGLLMCGAKQESRCLLVSWMVFTGFCSLNHLWVVFGNWYVVSRVLVALGTLLFNLCIFTIIISYFKSMKMGHVHDVKV